MARWNGQDIVGKGPLTRVSGRVRDYNSGTGVVTSEQPARPQRTDPILQLYKDALDLLKKQNEGS